MATICAICQSPLERGEATATCPGCLAEYHADCWEENQGCAVYGCEEVPPTEGRESLEIPAAYWGREDKPCPACGQTILAAAVRCRHCGATFESARPESSREFHSRAGHQKRAPTVRKGVVWLFVLGILPCTAPLTAVIGSAWYMSHRADLKKLPGVSFSLAAIGLAAAIGQTVMVILLTVLYALTQG